MIEVVFSEEEAVGVGQGKKVTIIPNIKSAGDSLLLALKEIAILASRIPPTPTMDSSCFG